MTDLFNLNQTFSSSSIVSTTDVQNVKHALNRLGYYAPPKDIGIMGFTDKAIFDALKQFQKDKNLLVTGEMRPSDTTVQMINRAIEDQPITTKYIWRTVQDDKVRSSHAVREGKVFSWLDHPVPGEEFKCRCWAEPFQGQKTANQIYDPPIEPVYSIEYLLGIGAGTRIIIGKAIEKATELTTARVMFATAKQLQSKFKHAESLGVKGNYKPQKVIEFKNAIEKHIISSDTKVIKGTYQGEKVTHFFNPKTNINVIKDSKGNYLSNWKLNGDQISNILRNGKLGGGK